MLPSIKKNLVNGGVYPGVGPNQNFVYISAIKPQLAFIVDIRHQNTMQHLVYKVLFELADTRAEFLSLLFSKPRNSSSDLNKDDNIELIIEFFLRHNPTDRCLQQHGLKLKADYQIRMVLL